MSKGSEAPKLFMVSKTMFILADDKERIRSSTIDNAFGSVDADISELSLDDEILKDFDSDTACYDVSHHDGREVQTLIEAADLIRSMQKDSDQQDTPPAAPQIIEPSPVEWPEKWPGDLTEEQQHELYKQGKLIPMRPKEEWAVGEWYRRPGRQEPVNFFVQAVSNEQAHIISETEGRRMQMPVSFIFENATHLVGHKPAESKVRWLTKEPSESAQDWLTRLGGKWERRENPAGWRATLGGMPIEMSPIFDEE